ncbi:hypothetical protein [Leifsonia sp. Leaf264]|uniref:hypothetical protein n=1 Tax=Leifsonia sp. Leaf264 TaxID=1736314 RepID=UPI0006F39444|nr:hypothetical protein [Leifsonia sp. Leaf264]KQO98754.1 hypothetical protein ASF30_11880 [Leifsonia sp. Leaf264]
MKLTASFAGAAAIAFLLSGCAASAEGAAEPTKTTAAAPTKTPEPTAEAEVDHPEGWEFCDVFVPGMAAYADYILETGNGDFVVSHHRTQTTYVTNMRKYATAEQAPDVAGYTAPYDQIDAVYKAGGGALSLNNQPYKDAVLPLTTSCVDIGYKMD